MEKLLSYLSDHLPLPGQSSIRFAFVRHRFLAKFLAISSVGKQQRQRGDANRTRIVYAAPRFIRGGRSFVTEDFVLELISVESYGRVKVNWSFELIVLFQIVFLIRICSNVNRGIKYKIERKLLNLDNLKKKFDKRIS